MLLVFFSAVLASCRETRRVEELRPLAVGTAEAQIKQVTKTVSYVGTVHSETEVTVLARVAGRVRVLPFNEGARVKKGQVVARLASPDLAAGVEQSSAHLRGAQAEQKYRCHWAEVHKGLAQKGHLSRSKADATRKACQSARAQLRAARAARRKTEALRAKTVERAPFEGVVLKKLSERGENILPGRPLLSLGGERKEIRVWVTQKDLTAGIQVGSAAVLESDGASERTKVTRVAPQATPSTHLFEVGIAIPGQLKNRFRHGSAVTVSFVLKESKGLVVPVDSVRKISKRRVVYRIQQGTAHAVDVKELFRNEDFVRVRSALKPGDLLAVTNLSSLRDQLKVMAVSQIKSDAVKSAGR